MRRFAPIIALAILPISILILLIFLARSSSEQEEPPSPTTTSESQDWDMPAQDLSPNGANEAAPAVAQRQRAQQPPPRQGPPQKEKEHPQQISPPAPTVPKEGAPTVEPGPRAAPLSPSWMAQPSNIDLDELQSELLEGEMRQEFELALREDRHQALRLARQTLELCPHPLDERARFAVEFRMRTEAGRGLIDSPQEVSSIYIEDPSFMECILINLEGLPFDAVGDGANLQVHWIYP